MRMELSVVIRLRRRLIVIIRYGRLTAVQETRTRFPRVSEELDCWLQVVSEWGQLHASLRSRQVKQSLERHPCVLVPTREWDPVPLRRGEQRYPLPAHLVRLLIVVRRQAKVALWAEPVAPGLPQKTRRKAVVANTHHSVWKTMTSCRRITSILSRRRMDRIRILSQ